MQIFQNIVLIVLNKNQETSNNHLHCQSFRIGLVARPEVAGAAGRACAGAISTQLAEWAERSSIWVSAAQNRAEAGQTGNGSGKSRQNRRTNWRDDGSDAGRTLFRVKTWKKPGKINWISNFFPKFRLQSKSCAQPRSIHREFPRNIYRGRSVFRKISKSEKPHKTKKVESFRKCKPPAEKTSEQTQEWVLKQWACFVRSRSWQKRVKEKSGPTEDTNRIYWAIAAA